MHGLFVGVLLYLFVVGIAHGKTTKRFSDVPVAVLISLIAAIVLIKFVGI